MLAVCSAITLTAQNKFDYSARNMLEEYSVSLKSQQRKMPDNTSVCAIVTLKDAAFLPQFESLGLEITDVKDDMIIVDMPLRQAESIAALDIVKHISFGGMATPMLNMARPASYVEEVQQASGIEKAYTGAGIITSLFDQGLDPNNINFKDAGGNSRVLGVVTVKGSVGTTTYYETKRQLNSFTTESADDTHGTHVLGIMSGSYNGPGNNAGAETDNLPYYGVATGSDIVVGCGDLFMNNILKGVKYAIDKGAETGQPVVVNLSLGNTTGAHDGSDSFSRYLDSYGEKAVIVVASGNDGDIPMGISKTFTTDDNTLKTFLLPHVITSTGGIINTASAFNGTVSFYSSDNRPFKFSVVIYTRAGSKIVSEYTVAASTSGKKTYIGGSSTGYEQLDKFDNATSASSYLAVSSNVSTDNNRYCATVDFNLNMATSSAYYLGFVIEGSDGQTINGYANSSNTKSGIYASFSSRSRTGWTDGTPDGSINSMACGKNLICIGSYNTRSSWPVLSGGNYSYTGKGFNVGAISPFSSYGTLYNGRTLPDLCAPGCGIVSTYNTYYLTSHPDEVKGMTASVTSGSKTYYWGNMQGTSMAAPYAAGTFAMWLEADPTLTVDEIRDIAKSTAYTDSYVTSGNPVQWGAGKLDALTGIKKVLDLASVGSILADDDRNFIVTATDGGYNVFVAGEAALNVEVYDMTGRVVASANADGNSVDIATSHLSGGIYIISATGANSRHSRKIAL